MANATIPSLGFSIRQSLDALAWQHGVYNEEFIQRMKLLFGHPDYFPTSSYGVVAPTNPKAATSGSSFPLVVSRNSTPNALTVDINPGLAVTKSGVWVLLSDFVRNVSLADTSTGVVNIIYLAYSLQPASIMENDFDEWVVPLEARIGVDPLLTGITGLSTSESSQIRVDTVDIYDAYPEEIKQNFIPLAAVTVQYDITLGAPALSIDHTADSYTWNRPWFSPVDIEHRSKLGSGVQSDKNVHALSQNEISAAGLTPFQFALDHGMIVSKDQSIEKVPGVRCQSEFPADQLTLDDAAGSNTGFPGKPFIPLPHYPLRLGKVWDETNGIEYAAVVPPQTNFLVFPTDPPIAGTTIQVYYTQTSTCEPPPNKQSITFTTTAPSAGEAIIAGGLAYDALANIQETFSDSTQFPMWFELYVDKDANLRKTPQVVYCLKRLDELGTQDTPEITQFGTGRLLVGLSGASGLPGMVVKIHVYGTDATGASIDSVVTFTNTNWAPFSIPATTLPLSAFQAVDQDFATITSIVVDQRTNDGPNSAIIIYACQTPYSTYDTLKDACHIAEVYWDGYRMLQVYDKRVVETTLRDFQALQLGEAALQGWAATLAGGQKSIFIENFQRPVLHSLRTAPDIWGGAIQGFFPSASFSKLQTTLAGTYMTRALPVYPGSGTVWRAAFLAQTSVATGSNIWVPTLPKFRLKLSSGWIAWADMAAVPGLPLTFQYSSALDPKNPNPAEVPIAVQMFVTQPYPFSCFALFG